MSEYDPKAARAKRPCPIWVDAILRDCGDLSRGEFGAYILILFKMWSNRECGIPADDRGLATVARISIKSWRRDLGPRLARFFFERDGWLYQKRLMREALKVEEFCLTQQRRKKGKKSPVESRTSKIKGLPRSSPAKVAAFTMPKVAGLLPPKRLKTLTPHATGDGPGILPSQLPNIADADAEILNLIPEINEALELPALLERCGRILGRNISRMTSFASLPDWLISWRDSGAQDFDIIVAMIGWARRDRRSAPSSPAYFTPIIEDATRRRTREREAQDDNGTRKIGRGGGDVAYIAAFLSAAKCFDA